MVVSGKSKKDFINKIEAFLRHPKKLEHSEVERKLAEEKQLKSQQELGIRNRINSIFLTVPDEKMYAEVLNLILEVMQSKFGTFGYFEENGAFVVPAMTRNIYWEKCNVPEKEIIFKRGKFGGIWDGAIKEKKTLFSNEGPFNTPKGHIPIKNTIVTPIIFHDKVISAIHVANKADGYDETDQVILEILARHIAPVLYARLRANKQDKERKRAEEALRHSKEEWEKTFNAISDWVVLMDLKERILRTNRAGEELVGVPVAEMTGQTCCKLLHCSDTPLPGCPLLKMIQTGHRETMELQLQDSNRWVAISVDPVVNEKGILVGAVHITCDITKRKYAEEEQKSTIELMHLLNATNHKHELMKLVTTFLKDWSDCEAVGIRLQEGEDFPYFETSGFPEEFVLAESKLCSVNDLGEIERDSQGKPYLGCMCGNIISGRFDTSKPFFTEHGSFWTNSSTELMAGTTETDRLVRTRDRFSTSGYESVALVPLWAGGKTFGLLQFNDKHKGRFTPEKITLFERLANSLAIGLSQRRAEEALHKSEEHLELFFSQSLDGFFFMMLDEPVQWDDTVDKEKALDYVFTHHRITKINDAMLLQYGASRKQFIGMTPNDLYAHDIAYGRNVWKEFFDEGNLHVETDERKLDGTPIWIEGDYICLYDSQGRITGHFGIQRDITERREAEQKVLENQAQLKSLASQLSLTEERERHRLATELHDQIGQSLVFSKIKLDQLHESASSDNLTRALEEVCNCLGKVIGDTRTLTFDLSSPILYELGFEAAVAEWLTSQIQEKHGIKTVFEDDGKQKPLDDDIRAILFRNVRELLVNIIKHARAKKVKVSIRRVDKYIHVNVEDNGVGFDSVEVTSTAAKGTKFGLFSIRQRLEQLGGHFEIDSEPGRGSRFTMTAPLK